MENNKNPIPLTMSQSWLLERLRYDGTTGELYWRDRPRTDFDTARGWRVWQARCAGKLAAPAPREGDSCPYKRLTLWGRKYMAHRIIWVMVTGYDPGHCLGHIGDQLDNRVSNLQPQMNGKRVHGGGRSREKV